MIVDSPYDRRADAVMQASVYRAIVLGKQSAEQIYELLLAGWRDRKVALSIPIVERAITALFEDRRIVRGMAGRLKPVSGAHLIVDYHHGVAVPLSDMKK